jgi:hypothetical protein
MHDQIKYEGEMMNYSKITTTSNVFKTCKETTHIYIEEEETERQVLRAIVRASFNLAKPVGMGWLHYKSETAMTDEDADQYISLPPRDSRDEVICMDYVQGRQCKTYINKVSDGHFLLSNQVYECNRGTPDIMLAQAEKLLNEAVA